ncbi:MAG: response regulator [Candidatus Binatia bacterium]
MEDNLNDIDLMLRSFRRHHLVNSICVARDGAEALDYVFGTGAHAQRGAPGQPKIILLDLNLPKLNGIEVLRQVKSDEHARAIPVVVLISAKHEREAIESYQLDVNSYIVKPVEFEDFVRAVSDAGLYWMVRNRRPA